MMPGKLGKPLPPHGDRRRYIHRLHPCRCPQCCTANTEYHREHRHANKPAQRARR